MVLEPERDAGEATRVLGERGRGGVVGLGFARWAPVPRARRSSSCSSWRCPVTQRSGERSGCTTPTAAGSRAARLAARARRDQRPNRGRRARLPSATACSAPWRVCRIRRSLAPTTSNVTTWRRLRCGNQRAPAAAAVPLPGARVPVHAQPVQARRRRSSACFAGFVTGQLKAEVEERVGVTFAALSSMISGVSLGGYCDRDLFEEARAVLRAGHRARRVRPAAGGALCAGHRSGRQPGRRSARRDLDHD